MRSHAPLAGLAAACAVIALAATGLAGCSTGLEPAPENARQGGSIDVAIAAPPDSLDPVIARSPEAVRALWLVHTPPLTYARADGAAGTELVPGLARELPEVSRGGLTYRFTLRAGRRYSNGRLLRAGDVERGIARALRLRPVRALERFGGVVGASEYAARRGSAGDRGADVSGIRADRSTREVRIDLRAPDPAFPHALASLLATPVPALRPAPGGSREGGARPREDGPGERSARRRGLPPGIGPYRLGRPRGSEAFVLARVRSFELAEVPDGNVDEIAAVVVADPGERARAAIAGRVDVVQDRLPRALLPEIRGQYEARYREDATLALAYLRLDDRRPPFDDEDVRRAVALAIDLAALDRLRDGFLEPACNLIPPQVPGFEALDPCPYGQRLDDADLEGARELVETAREDGPVAPVLIRAPLSLGGTDLGRYLVSTLRSLGMTARLARTPSQRAAAQVAFARRDPAAPHPARYLEIVPSPVVGARVALADAAGTASELATTWAELDAEAIDAARVVPYGVEAVGTLASERLDSTNCSRFHPVFGLDWSSLCLR